MVEKLIYHFAGPTGSQVTPCSWSQKGRWQGLALSAGRCQVSRKHKAHLKNSSLSSHREQCSRNGNLASPRSARLSLEELLKRRGTAQTPGRPTKSNSADAPHHRRRGLQAQCISVHLPQGAARALGRRASAASGLGEKVCYQQRCSPVGWQCVSPCSYHPSSVGTHFGLGPHH